MPADKAEKGEKLTGLNQTLTSIENDLLRKRADRSDGRYFKLLDNVLAGAPVVTPSDGKSGPS